MTGAGAGGGGGAAVTHPASAIIPRAARANLPAVFKDIERNSKMFVSGRLDASPNRNATNVGWLLTSGVGAAALCFAARRKMNKLADIACVRGTRAVLRLICVRRT